jgi:beta-1,2-mannobiose phosphorylase / 1,2-beta-oligomannan phosphorylase
MYKMKRIAFLLPLVLYLFLSACKQKQNREIITASSSEFPKEMVGFVPYEHNPLFSGTNSGTWDKHIRERGFILHEDGIYKMWFTGYSGGDNDPKSLGYATSDDGLKWIRYPANPIFSQKWTEDMFVLRNGSDYCMYAEGKNDVAHLLTSPDGINWNEQGDLVILTTGGDTIPGPYGTPSVLIENGKWYLFYERDDLAIWIATSEDKKTWTNIQDEPVLKKGPGTYDAGAVASNQVVKYNGKYFMYYHGSNDPSWNTPGASSVWSSNVAMSTDLIHWAKYPKNPIIEGDHSSPILVSDGNNFRLYTMHNEVCLYFQE